VALPEGLEARYRVGEVLGQGAFGAVYRATPLGGGPDVAIKILGEGYDQARLGREVAALRRIDHPHVLCCRDVGAGWMALELADGTACELWRDPARAGEAWEALVAAARGAAAMHREGVAHRDLKPDNLLRVGDRWVVADLGLAKVEDLETLTATGMIQGTPRYMAPEQALGRSPGPPCDAWALGMMAYEVLEGRTPWPADEAPVETLMRLARGERPRWARGPERLSTAGFAAVQRALAPEPAERPQDLDAWADVLAREALAQTTTTQEGSEARATIRLAPPSTPRAGDTTRRRRARPGRRLLAAVGLAGLIGAFFLGGGEERPQMVEPQGGRDPLVELAAAAHAEVDRWLEGAAVDAEGRPVGPGPEATRSLRMLSPRHFDGLAARVAPLADLGARFEAGLDGAEMEPPAREALRGLATRFRSLGLPSPGHPMVAVLPEPEREVPEDEGDLSALGRIGHWTGRDPDRVRRGWFAAGLQATSRLEAATLAREEAETAFLEGRWDPPWPNSIRRMMEGVRLQFSIARHRGMDSPLRTLNSSLRNAEEGAEVWDHYRSELEAAEEAAYALLRATQEEPEVAVQALVVLYSAIFDPDDLVLHPVRCVGRDFPPVPVREHSPVAALALRVRHRWTLVAQRELVGIDAELAVPEDAELEAVSGIAETLLADEGAGIALCVALRLLRELTVWRAETDTEPEPWGERLAALQRRAFGQLGEFLHWRLWDAEVQAARRHHKYNQGLAPALRPWVELLLEVSAELGERDPKTPGRLREILGR
jgi:hypothetical protein